MNTTEARKAKLETQLSEVVGAPVEITIRGLLEFTLSAEGDKVEALEAARAFFGGALASWKAEFDAECDYTCAWFSFNA